MRMQILSVGFEVPGGVVECVPFESSRSLLDADLIVFQPRLGAYEYDDSFQGKHSLTEHDSFEVRERLRHSAYGTGGGSFLGRLPQASSCLYFSLHRNRLTLKPARRTTRALVATARPPWSSDRFRATTPYL